MANTKEKFPFPRGFNVVNIPFILGDSWKETVAYELKKLDERYTFAKNHSIGFSIDNFKFGTIIITRYADK